ncbi:tRNA processing endoribonuclease [Colletotrichum truncatum]|uniref:tRNA processing endoribonuclease n=1 Tax=Colletotrichum truncatum TaxID=5467 RepID=A0ACC3YKC5_COLTU|nr:tRNA processing endoribonuclease [Colletotrichum truncatum]KAF6794489.1 tRNA processing endoribonuclease [Colletotrichum truncatum]
MDTDWKNKGPRACTTCAKAKSRCIPGPEGSNKCERCHRLRKPCGSQTPAPPRAKKDPKPTKVAELERRLDELTTQLNTTQGGTPEAPAPAPAVTGSGSGGGANINSNISPLPITNSNKPTSARIPINVDHLFPPAEVPMDGTSDTSPAPSSSTFDGHHTLSSHNNSQSEPAESPWPLNNESNLMLQTFKDELQPLYPFVIVPPHMGPAELAAERPYLWKGIMMTACHLDATRQVTLGNELLEDIVQSAFTKPKKSLDVLQGLQLLIAWYHYNINSFQLTNLLFLARSMCISLGFKDNPISIKERERGICINVQDPAAATVTKEQMSTRLELMRAFAGCYYLNTLVFTTNKRPDAFMNTTYLESCCRQIQERAEYPSDELLVQLFKIQQLAQTISLTLGAESTSFQSLQLPLTMVVQSFQQQLDIFKTSIPQHLKDNAGLLTHVSIAEILLYEIGIRECQGSTSYISLTERLELLWGCCNSVKTFLELRFPRDNRSIQPRFTCLSSSDFLYVFIVSLKLMTLEVPGWDLPLIQKHIDLAGVVDSQVKHLELFTVRRARRPSAAETMAAEIPGPKVVDPFLRLTMMLRYFKDLVRGELSSFKTQPAIQEPILLPANLSDGTQAMIRDLDASFWNSMLSEDPGTWDAGSMFSTMDWTAT